MPFFSFVDSGLCLLPDLLFVKEGDWAFYCLFRVGFLFLYRSMYTGRWSLYPL